MCHSCLEFLNVDAVSDRPPRRDGLLDRDSPAVRSRPLGPVDRWGHTYFLYLSGATHNLMRRPSQGDKYRK